MIYHSSCARRVASMKKETRRSCSARKRIESEYCRLKGSFTENPHGRVQVAEEQTENSHGRVEITHRRVLVTEERAAKTHGPVEIPQGRVPNLATAQGQPHGLVASLENSRESLSVPHGRVSNHSPPTGAPTRPCVLMIKSSEHSTRPLALYSPLTGPPPRPCAFSGWR